MTKSLDNLRQIDKIYTKSFPSSEKVYIQGSKSDIQVPMQKITLSPTITGC